MNIEYGNYTDRNDIPVNSRYSGNVTSNDNITANNSNNGADELSALRPGDTFTGTVVQNKNNNVILHIDGSDAYVSATLEGTDNYYKDQKITFQVVDNHNGKITIKPLGTNDIMDSLAQKSLLSQGIAVNDKNISIVKALINNNQSLSKTNIIMMAKGLATIDGATVSDLVKLLKYDISINQENFNIYKKYNEGTESIQNDINTIVKNLKDMYEAGESDFMKLMQEILKLDDDTTGISGNDISNGIKDSTDVDNISFGKNIVADDSSSENISAVSDNNKSNNVVGTDSDSNNVSDITSKDTDINNGSSITGKDVNINNGNSTTGKDVNINNANSITGKDANINNGNDNDSSITGKDNDIVNGDRMTDAGSDIDKNSDITDMNNNSTTKSESRLNNASNETSVNVNLNTDIRELISKEDADKIIRYMSKTSNDILVSDKVTLENILNHSFEKDTEVKDSVIKLFENVLKNSMAIKSEELYKGEVSEYFKKVLQKLDMITNYTESYMKSETDIATAAQSVKDNINFMNEMNNTMQFVQFPVNINGKEHQAELYVYRNKKNVNSDKEEKTAFIRLDMEHLGNVEVYVKLYNKDVNMKFYVESEDAGKVLEDNIAILNERVTKLGYNVKEEFLKNNHKWNFEEDFMKKSEPYTMLKKTGFDVKA